MAITSNQAVLSLLKTYYRDQVQNLLFRNSPVLMNIKKERVEGKEQAFSAIYGRGGAVSADFTVAKAAAQTASKAVEFKVTPGDLFSCYTLTPGEVQASQTRRGAYMKVAGAKMFACTEGFRQVMAAALYGTGFGELAPLGAATSFTQNTETEITMPADAILKIDIDSVIDLKESVDSYTVKAKLTVKAIDGETVKVESDTTVSGADTDILAISGCVSGSSANPTPKLPVGLAGWLPSVADRSGSDWTDYIAKSFFDVDRSIAPDRLAGSFYKAASTEDASESVKAAIKLARRHGSRADIIVMNDDDFAKFAEEIETTNTFFTATSTLDKKNATVGISRAAAAFSTNYIENIWDDPYCPKGTFYVLDSEVVELWSYTNADEPLKPHVAGNDPGKADPMNFDDRGKEKDPYGLIIDDYINIAPGADSPDGPSSCVSLTFYGSFVVLNPSVCAVGKFNYA